MGLSSHRHRPKSAIVATFLAMSVLIYGCVTRDVLTAVIGEVIVAPDSTPVLQGGFFRLTATVRDENGDQLPPVPVEWESETPGIVTVDAEGVVTGVSEGTGTVTATYRGVSGSATVYVIPAPAISVQPDSARLFGEVGASVPPDTLLVDNGGQGSLGTLSVEVTYPPGEPTGWLSAILVGTRAPTNLVLRASSDSLDVGRYQATVLVTAPNDANGPFEVPVHLSLTGLTVTPSGVGTVVSESGSSDTLSVVLDAPPDSAVVLAVSSADVGEITVSPETLVFGPTDYAVPQLVVVTGVNEFVRDGDQVVPVTIAVVGDRSDEAFVPIAPKTIDVTNTDNDTGSFTITESPPGTSVGEDESVDDFTVVLDAQPLDTVVFQVAVRDSTEVSVSPAELVFVPAEWDSPQMVTVQGRDDDVIDGTQTSFVLVVVDSTRSDAAFIAAGLDSLAVSTLDDDSAGFTLAATGGGTEVSEAGTADTVTVVLAAEPAANVVFNVAASDPEEVGAVTSPITFTPADWDVPQPIVVTGGDDQALDGDQVTSVTVTVDGSSDAAFTGLSPQSFDVTTRDDDVAGLTLVETDGSTATDEAGLAPDSFSVALAAQPAGSVAIDVASSDETEVVLTPARLVFTASTWNQPQPIVVTGVDERFDDGDRPVGIVLTVDTAASHQDYDLVAPDSVIVTNIDDDTAGFTLVQSEGGTLVTEAGSSDSVTVVLTARPRDNVVITLLSADTTEVTVSPALLTFTTDNWDTPQPFVLTGVDDGEPDGNRFSLIAVGVSGALSDASFADVADQTVLVTTINDDAVSVSVTPTRGLRTDESGGTASFSVVLGSIPQAVVTIDLTSSDPGEGMPSPTTLTFNATDWNVPQTVTVTGVDDAVDDGDQGYSIQTALSSADPDYAAVDPSDVTVVNADNDDAPTLVVDDVTVTEGDAGTVNAVFTVTQSIASTNDVTVAYATSDGSATAPSDYSAVSGSLTFPAGGPLTQTITVPVNGDLIDEGASESFTLSLSGATNATILDGSGTATVVDDDGPPSLSISDVTVTEGNSGTVNAQFTVTQSASSGQTVTVNFATVNGTAVSGSDYVATSGPLSFAPGSPLTRTIDVVVNGDLLDEGSAEEFTVQLSGAVNATLLDPSGTGTILDDDDPPTLSIDDVTVLEGDAGTVSALFTVTLSAASGQTVIVGYSTADGTASAGSDYTAASGTLTFAPGGSLAQTIAVIVSGDLLDDGVSEDFTVSLGAATNASILRGTGVGTITDDDDAPTLSIGDVTVTEGNSGTVNAQFTVTQSAASGLPVTVDYATTDGTATLAGADYTATSGTLTFAPGSPLTRTINVVVNGDLLDEGASETFVVGLSNATNAAILDGSATGTITDDDGPPSLAIDDITVTEGNSGTVDAVLTVTQSAPSGLQTTVDYATVAGSAAAGSDYVAVSGTLTFAPGVTTQSVTVAVNGDLLDEGASEAFTVSLTNPVNATVSDATGVVTISDDDGAPTLSIDDVTVVEGNAGTVDAVFTVTQSAPSGLTTSVDFATADGTASAGSDYVATSGTLTFAPGATSRTITVTVNGDLIEEGLEETFTVSLSNAVNATIADPSGTGTITDDEDPPVLSIGNVIVTEGDAGTVTALFTVTQSIASSQTVTVDYATADGTAAAGFDYVAVSGSLTFAPGGALTETIAVTVNGDEIDEGASETFAVNLTNAVNATLGNASAVGTITDDDAPPTLSINDVTVTEGNVGPVNATFTVTLSGQSSLPITVDYGTVDGTATVADGDYDALSGTLSFAPGGALTQTITVIVNGDSVDEPGAAETFTVELTNPVNATISDGSGTGTIIDDEGTPALLVDDATVVEGDAGTVDVVFTVSLSATSGQTVTVDYATADGTATAGLDFVATSGTLTFLTGGALAQSVTVTVNGDLIDEGASEGFTLELSNATNAAILVPSGDGTITDDDDATLSIDDVTVLEGDVGQVNAVFNVTMSLESSSTVTVDYATADGTATAGSDYASTTGTVSFLPGGALTQTITVPVNGDAVDEGVAETFSVALSNPSNATILDGVGVGTITDDDDPPTLSIADVTVIEGDNGTVDAVFTVTQSSASSQTVTVDYATAGGTATSGVDFVAASGTLTFLPGGAVTQTVTVVVNGDVLDEGVSESFSVNLSNGSNATIADPTGIGTITDDDAAPSLSIDDVTVVEGNSGTVSAVFTVTQSALSGQAVSVDYGTVDGSALAGSDYIATSGTLSFPAGGPLTRTITVLVTGDALDEAATETFDVTLTNPVNATVSNGTGIGSIADDDDPPTLSIGDAVVVEGNAGPVNAQFTVTMSTASNLPVSIDYATVDVTASATAGDYAATSGTLSFAPGSPLIRTITVQVNGDVIDEGLSESFQVELTNPDNATVTDGTGVGTITDDDDAPVLSIDDVTVTEGDTGTTDAVFTVTRSGESAQSITVNFSTADGTATAPADYTSESGTLTFAPGGAATQTVTVAVIGDQLDEGVSETFTVGLSGATNATIGDPSGTGTIVDDDGAPTLSVNDVSVVEGDAGTVEAVFTVTQSASSGQTVTVDYITVAGTATAGSDYVATSGTLTFTAGGPLTRTVTISVVGDLVDEGVSEAFTLELSNASNAVIADASGTGTITDDDDAQISINDVTLAEGNSGTTNATFTVTLSLASSQTVTLDYATADATATVADGDYVATSGTLTFAPGSALTRTVDVVVVGDQIQEGSAETFTVELSNAVNASVSDASGLGTIVDDDGTPSLFVNDVSVVEGDAGTVNATFTVTKSNESQATVTVDYATSDGTASAGSDYASDAGTLTFAPGGALTQTVSVVVNGDAIDEGTSETFTLELSNAVNAGILDASGTGTITDDDDATLSIADVTVTEGNSGTVNADFVVTKSLASSQTVTVDFTTVDGTAVAGSDYVAVSGSLSFDPSGALTQTITVVVAGDVFDEGSAETFTVALSNAVGASIADGTGLGTITDDDDAPTLSVDDVTVTEGASGTVSAVFTITQSAVSNQPVSVVFATADGSAVAGTDYQATSGTATILPGGLTQTVTVLVNGDLLDEGASETFSLELSSPSNATIADGSGTGTILDDDDAPTLSIDDVTVTEGNVGTVGATFTVSLSDPSGLTVSVDYLTSDGTATAGTDYTASGGTLTFTPGGALSQTITVFVSGDLLDEGASESFNVDLVNAVNAGTVGGSGLGTILDDDPEPSLSINDVTVTEGDTGTVTAFFTVTLSAASGQTVTVTYATGDVSASAGSDYQAAAGTLTFSPGGSLTQTVPVLINGDAVDEGSAETFTVTLGAPTNATISGGTGAGTIIDDDGPPSLSIGDVTVTEGDGGTVNAQFTVTQSAASGLPVTVLFTTVDGTATVAGSDYSSASGSLTFQPGDLTQPITVAVNGDLLDEGTAENFTVVLSNSSNATIADATGIGTITDDDDAPSIAIGDVTVNEGDGGTVDASFTLTLSAASGLPIGVSYATADGTATLAGSDYVATSGSVTFQPGDPLTRSVIVPVNGDLLDEGTSEDFSVILSNPSNVAISDGTGVGTISDDDDPPTLSIDDVTVTEGNSGAVNAIFTVTQSAASGLQVTVDYATADGTATVADSDYAARSGTLIFDAGGSLTQTISVPVNGDLVDEGAFEEFTVVLGSPINATLNVATGTATIIDDEGPPTVFTDDVTVLEGDAGTVDAVFTVSLSSPSSQTVTVDYATSDVTATVADGDYAATSGTVTFTPGGPLSQTVTVTVNGDLVDEGVSESFAFNLSNAVNASIADPSETGTITDDDDATLSIDDVTVPEGDSGSSTAIFTVSKSLQSDRIVSVAFSTADGTATTADGDYDATSGALTFLPGGPLTMSIPVTINGDVLDEGVFEDFTVELSSVVGGAILDGDGIGTITDDDSPPSLSIDDVALLEGDAGSQTMTFSVALSAPSGQTVTVDYATSDGTAVAPGDYTTTSGPLSFAPGVTTQTVSVEIIGDVLDEIDESFNVTLSNPSNATILDGDGVGTITDDDPPPSLSIDDVALLEGDAGSQTMTFTVALSAPSGRTVTVDYATSDGTAVAPGDYTTTSGPLSFAPGVTTQAVSVEIIGDVLDEIDETFNVTLSNPSNATILDGDGIGTITDDDPPPSLNFIDVTLFPEGDAGSQIMTFSVTLSAPSGRTVTVDYATSDGTAVAPGDYTATSGQLSFAPGATTRTVSVEIIGDVLDEINETFNVTLSNPSNATIADGDGFGTITDDDPPPSLSIDDVALLEGDAGSQIMTFTVALSAPSGRTVTVDYATSDGTAVAPGDYTTTSGQLSFAPGVTTQTVGVEIIGDVLGEANETFNVTLSNPSNATIADGDGVGTIIDDDPGQQ